MGEENFISIAGLMAAEMMKEDTDAREVSYSLGDQVEVLPLAELPEMTEQEIEEHIYWINDPVTLEVKCNITRLQVYSLLAGRKITNNWLKLHGGAMVRKPIKYMGKGMTKIG